VFILAKVVVWTITGSVGVLAEALHSCADLIGSSLALISLRFADNPPDAEHEYGHGKFENMSGMLIGILVLGAGIGAIAEAVQHLNTRHAIIAPIPAIIVMGLSAISNALVSRNLLRVGHETDSPALTADGRHLQTDIVTSVSVFVGLILIQVTGAFWIDPAAAVVVAIFIFTTAIRIARDSLHTLSDAALPAEEEEILRRVLADDPRVLGFHKLRTRKSGSHRHVDVHIQIADTHSFVTAHQIGEEIEDSLRRALPNVHPIIHYEPYEDEVARQRTLKDHDVPH
jgi:cation diffusion facilitator family transporter